MSNLAEGKVYEYRLGLLANLLNPPELFIFRGMGILSILIGLLFFFNAPINPIAWGLLAFALFITWFWGFRNGLPLYVKGELAKLVISENLISLEIGAKFFYVPKKGVVLKSGLLGTLIVRIPNGNYLLVNQDAVSLEKLKSEIEIGCFHS